MSTKKIGIIGSVGVPANYGGFETLTEQLVINLASQYDITVCCSAKAYPQKQTSYKGASLIYVPLNANGIQSIPYDIISLLKLKRDISTVLILGVASGFFLPFYKLFSKKKIILNVDGLEWKREKWGRFARFFLKYSERIAVKCADEIVADNKAIAEHIKENYNKESSIIAYGGDHVVKKPISDDTKSTYPFLKHSYAFSVCRIEPENNIHVILSAFAELNFNLCIIGNWNNSEYGINLRKQYQEFSNITLLDPIYNQEVLDEFRGNCTVYIHGHSAGGTNPSLVEAMMLKLSILAFDVNYNRYSTNNLAIGYFQDKDDLIELMLYLERSDFTTNNEAIYEFAKNNYTWKVISQKYSRLF